jgi:hypothetical protein
MKMRIRTIALALTAILVSATAPIAPSFAAPGDNAVVQWNENALQIITSDTTRGTPSAASLYVAITQLAVYDAVMAIAGTHEPYAFDGDAPGASMDAAVATAARDVLVNYFGAAAASVLDGESGKYTAALAAIPDGAAKTAGIEVGHSAAQAIIALRANDGRTASVPEPANGTEPGQWRRTGTNPSALAVTPYVGQVTPFLAESPEQFRPKGPNRLDSHAYAVEFERTRLYGAKTGSLRDEEQTEIALFWTENTLRQYNRALRDLANERGLSTTESAVLFAMTDVPAADAMITCWNTKYHYSAWRPVTAINAADTDGNPLTTKPETLWEPLSTTGLHPEYVSGHACLTGAITRGLREFLGTKDINFWITFVSSTLTIEPRFYATIDDLRTEVEDARVYGGDHWTSGGVDGTILGDDLAKYALHHYFEEIK